MANGNLIQGARRIGQSKRFVDYGKVLGEAMKPTQGMLLAKQQYFNAIKEKEAKTQNFIDNLSDLDLTKIPTGLRNQVTDFLTTGRQKYYDASERAANARMGLVEDRNAVREMNNVNHSCSNLSGGLDNLLERRTEFLTDKDANNISNGDITDSKYYDNLSILGADLNDPEALTLSISEAGDVGFVIKGIDGQDKIINEIPNWNNKASATSDSLAKMSETYNINGQKGIEVTDKILKDNVYRTIGDNRSNIVSLATDSWLGAPALINESNIDAELYQGLTGAELLNPENQAALKSYVNDRYYNGIKDAYSSGYGVYNKRKDEAVNAEKQKDAAILSDIDSIIENSTVTVSAPPPIGFTSWDEFRQKNPNQPIPSDVTEGESVEQTNKKIVRNIANEYNTALSAYPFTNVIDKDEAFANFYDNAQENPELYGLSEEDKVSFSKGIDKGVEVARRLFEEQYGDAVMFSITKEGTIAAFTGDIRDSEQIAKFLSNKRIITGKSIKTTEALTPSAELD